MNNDQDNNTVQDTSRINKQNNITEMNRQLRKMETPHNQKNQNKLYHENKR